MRSAKWLFWKLRKQMARPIITRRLRLEQLEDRNLLSASWLGNMAGPDGLMTQFSPIVQPDGTAAVVWDGQVHKAVAGQWVARFYGVAGSIDAQVDTIQDELNRILPAALNATVVRQLGLDGQVLIQVSTNVPEDQLQCLANLSNVLYVEPNIAEATISLLPNDTDFNKEYGLRNTGQTVQGQPGIAGADISATQAWNITTGSYSFVIADIDTGADYTHPDLRNNIWFNNAEIPNSRLVNLRRYVSNPSNPDDTSKPITFADLNDPQNWGLFKITPHMDGGGNMVVDANDVLANMNRDGMGNDLGTGGWAFPGNTKDGDLAHPNDYVGWNFVNNTNRPFDDNSHGTHTAGTIGAQGNNGIGVSGVNWHTSIMVLKFLDAGGGGSFANGAAAINYSVLHGAKVSNNSWSGGGIVQVVYDAVKNARDNGDLFVAAAGNNSANNDTANFTPSSFTRTTSAGPALNNIIAVAATDNRDQLAGFSNYGANSVQLGAPGVNVWSTFPTAQGSYAYDTGTSMATPHVAGAAALVWGYFPASTYLNIKNALLQGVDLIPSLNGKTTTGGRLDVNKAFTFFGTAPVLSPIADQTISSGQQVLNVTLSATGTAPITYAAIAQSLAYVLTQQTGTLTYFSVWNNYGGQGEKWLQATGGQWYFILAGGGLYQWDGGAGATGTLLGNVGSSYYADPTRLTNPPATDAHYTLSILGSTLTITRNDLTWTGTLVLTVTASNAGGSDSKSFKVFVMG